MVEVSIYLVCSPMQRLNNSQGLAVEHTAQLNTFFTAVVRFIVVGTRSTMPSSKCCFVFCLSWLLSAVFEQLETTQAEQISVEHVAKATPTEGKSSSEHGQLVW